MDLGSWNLCKNLVKQIVLPTDHNVPPFKELYRACVLVGTQRKLTSEEIEQLFNELGEAYGLTIGEDFIICSDEDEPWFQKRTGTSDNRHWARFEKYLAAKLPNTDLVHDIDRSSSDIMNHMGNPALNEFNKRGLVVGDVQSGKTNSFIAVINKAADVGYKVIVILSGMTNALRLQTQHRIDEGFVGTRITDTQTYGIPMGVGHFEQFFPNCLTGEKDFRKKYANNYIREYYSNNEPFVLVIKKNKSILQRVRKWFIETYNIEEGKTLDLPMLLIDDEADNASINVSKVDISAINGAIRDLMALFNRNTYCGYTATPYANIFIDPNAERDLFPKDFIKLLGHSSNYIGGNEMFAEGGKYCYQVKTIPHITGFAPSHKITSRLTTIPPSMLDAVNCFILTCAIRDLRPLLKTKHMSMLINASLYTDIQESICSDIVRPKLEEIKQHILAYSHLSCNEALKDPFIRNLKQLFDKEYGECGNTWEEVQHMLAESVDRIEVGTVNRRSKGISIRYEDHKEGLRVIAIGGYSLSRGLTLEGLAVSYFYRNAKTYDTLLQMARWFGYRDGYADLCRVWMTEESIGWAYKVNEATEELKKEIALMDKKNLTPESFGLRVRNDVVGFTITSLLKLRNASDETRRVFVGGKVYEATSIYIDRDRASANYRSVCHFIELLHSRNQAV